jgi:hypothetical protein
MECSFAVVNPEQCQELRYAVVPLREHSVLTKAIILLRVVPVHAMMTWGSGGIALLILSLGTRWNFYTHCHCQLKLFSAGSLDGCGLWLEVSGQVPCPRAREINSH